MFFAIAIALLIFEIVTGSFYLLVISAAFATAGLAGFFFDMGTSTGFVITAVVSLLGIFLVKKHHKRIQLLRKDNNDDLADLDKGQVVHVNKSLPDGKWQVHYRGTIWLAQNIGDGALQENDNAIIESKNGNILHIRKVV